MTDPRPVAVVIPTWNSTRWIGPCLDAVRAQTLTPAEIVVVDDASSDGTWEWLREHAPDVRVERSDEHRGFAATVNRGIRSSTSPLVALLNADTLPASEWLESLVSAIEGAGPQPGFVASKMVKMSTPDRIDNAGDGFSRYGSARKRGHDEPEAHWATREAVLSACAGAALYRRELLDEVGLFDETFESYLEDVDLGLRARSRGHECLFEPSALVRHQGGASGLPRRRYVRLVTANRLATLLKNFPGPLLWRHCLRLFWGQCYFLLAYRRPLSSLLGYWDALRRLPEILRRRRRCQAARTLGVDAFDDLLDPDLGEPPLKRLVARRMGFG